jgi:hypothetical protein
MARFWEHLVPGWERMTDEEILAALAARTAKPKPGAGPVVSTAPGRPFKPVVGGGPGSARVRPLKPWKPPRGAGKRVPAKTGPGWVWWFFLKRYRVVVDRNKYEFTPACVVAVFLMVVYVLYLLGFRL